MPAQGGGMEIIMAYKIKLSVFILIIMLFPINIYAWSGVSGIEWLKDTPSENIFRIEGSPRKFILLDRTDDKDPTFFIFTKECYADRAFDSNRKNYMNPKDGANLCGWLNTNFLKNGSTIPSGEVMALPNSVIEHIDMNHKWKTDYSPIKNNENDTYGLSVLSQEEMIRYKDMFGVDDGMSTSRSFRLVAGWWIRTHPKEEGGKLAFRFLQDKGTNIYSWGAASDGIGVRPCFYLKRDFFTSVRLNLNDPGENVIKMIKKTYLKEELEGIYSEAELLDVFGYTSDLSIDLNTVTKDKDSVYANVTCKNNSADEKQVMQISAVFTEDNRPVSFSAEYKSISANQTQSSDIKLNLPEINEKNMYLKVYCIEPGRGNRLVSNSKRFIIN